MPKINDALVRSLEPPGKGNRVIYDEEVTGFGIRVTANNAKSFVLRYVFDDPDAARRSNEYRYTIGPYPAWSVAAARSEAKDWVQQIGMRKSHPMAEKTARRAAVKARKEAETYEEAVEDYIKREQVGRRRNATAFEVRRVLLREGSLWKDWPLLDITPAEIRRQLETVRDGDRTAKMKARPYLANRFFAYLGGFFRWASEPGIDMVVLSPMIGLRRPWEGEEARDRVYSDDEIRALWAAADNIGNVAGAYLKLAILTGKRRGALASMRWVEIGDDGVWTPQVDARRKKRNKRLHAIPLPGLALRVIAPLRNEKSASPHVFPGRTSGSRITPGSSFQTKVRENSKVDDFFLHACRHTLETRFAELRVPPHVRDLILDHAPNRGAGGAYDHYSYVSEMREALDGWASHVEGVVSPTGTRKLR